MMAASLPKPHAVFLPYPHMGHINPMLQFSEILASKGFVVTLVNTQFNHAKLVRSLADSGVASFQDQGLDLRMVGIPDGFPPEHTRSDVLQLTRHTESVIIDEFEKLMEDLMNTDTPVTCIIADVIISAVDRVNISYGLPRVYFWTARTATFLIYHHLPLLHSKGCLPITEKNRDQLITDLPGVPPLRLKDFPTFLQDDSSFYYDWMHRMFEPLKETDWIFVNAFYELEQDAYDYMQTTKSVLQPVGPLLPPSYLGKEESDHSRVIPSVFKEDQECLEWLDKQPSASVLYVSFGSFAVLSVKQVEELALGLEHSEVPFLWTFRPDFVMGGEEVDPEVSLIMERSERGRVVSWAPQLRVLSHPSVGGFLTHCGWNSTLETICMGVPTLGWPNFAEQKMNCRWMVEQLKIGLDFRADPSGLVTKNEVERVVRALMLSEEGKGMRDRAGKLKLAARKAAAEDRSDKIIDAFLIDMTRRAQERSAAMCRT